MNVLCVTPSKEREIKNVAYPRSRPRGMWQRFTRLLANIFSTPKKSKAPDYGACITCIYWQDWKCLQHRTEKAATGPRCKEYIDVTSMPLPDVVAIRKKLSY